MTTYKTVVEIAHGIIAEGFSSDVITPGMTSTEDGGSNGLMTSDCRLVPHQY